MKWLSTFFKSKDTDSECTVASVMPYPLDHTALLGLCEFKVLIPIHLAPTVGFIGLFHVPTYYFSDATTIHCHVCCLLNVQQTSSRLVGFALASSSDYVSEIRASFCS